MRIAYFDCFGGISGDMALGALLDAGANASILDRVLAVLGLEEEVSITRTRVERGHLGALLVGVGAGEGSARSLPELERLVREAAELPDRVRSSTLAALDRIGSAEAQVHGLPRDQIHLHELGGADTLVDLVGTFWLLEQLGVEEVYASPLPMAHGFGREFPHPAPATARLLADAGAVLVPSDAGFEQVTPTGAALLSVLARFERPAFRARQVGYGAGARNVPGNALRVWLGDLLEVPDTTTADTVTVIETNLDDLAPIFLPALIEDLMAAGALDVSVATAQMKKGRNGQLITILAPPDRADDLARQLLRSTPTLGVRITEARRLLAERRLIEVETELGRATVKLKLIDGVIVEANPEYEDCRRIARESGRDLREVMRLVTAAAGPTQPPLERP